MVQIYDRFGHEQSWDWLEARFGPLVIHPKASGPGWQLVELHENADLPTRAEEAEGIMAAAIIMVNVRGQLGDPAPNVKVAWYWPDAPLDPNAGPANGLPTGMNPGQSDRPGITNGAGDIAFAMGGGAYYFPPGIGPHATWIYGADTNSDVLLGLGMLGGTNHDSLWPVFQLVDDGEEEPEEPEPGDPEPRTLREALLALENAIAQVRQAL
jgi:hypothetical protein